MENEVEKTYGKLEWFLYMIFLPLMFTVILTAILLQFLGYNVKGELLKWGNSIPYVEKVIPGSNPKPKPADSAGEKASQKSEEDQKKITELNQKLEQERDKLAKLEAEAKAKDVEIEKLKRETERMRQQIEAAKKEQDENPKREVAQLYTSMSPSKAAPIMAEMPMNEAVKILKLLKQNERSAILAKLEPKMAAEITSELLKGE